MMRRPTPSTLFPYTTLFRSVTQGPLREGHHWFSYLLCAAAPHVTRANLGDRKSTRLNSSHTVISYAVFCLKKKTISTSDTKTTPMANSASKNNTTTTQTTNP